MKTTQNQNLKRATCSIKLPAEDGLPTKVHVMPLGSFTGFPDGTEFYAGDAQAIIDRSIRENVKKIKIDREHETTLAPKGAVIPATGWAFDFYADEDGIWAKVKWTPNGAYEIAQEHYGYISPEFIHDGTGNVKYIKRISVTGSPRLDVKALANQDVSDFTELSLEDHDDMADDGGADSDDNTQTEEKPIMNKDILEALGLKENATEAETLAAVKSLQTAMASQDATIKSLAKTLKIDEDAKSEDMLATASQIVESSEKQAEIDPSKYVPMADYQAVCSQLNTDMNKHKEEKAKALIENAIAEGRVTPASRDHFIAYANQDFEACEKLLGSTPKIIQNDKKTPDQEAKVKTTLSKEEQAICSQMGLTAEEFLAEGTQSE